MVNNRHTVGTRVTNVALLGTVVGVLAQIVSPPVHRPKLGLRLRAVTIAHIGAENETTVDPPDSVPSGCGVAAVVVVVAITQQPQEVIGPSGPQPDLCRCSTASSRQNSG